MIIVYGSIYIDIEFEISSGSAMDCAFLQADQYHIKSSGRAPNQALAAVRSGAKTGLIGRIGNDIFAGNILQNIRKEGVITSGVAQGDEPTGMQIHLRRGADNSQRIYTPGANTGVSADQAPSEVLGEGALVLLQTDLSFDQNMEILQKAKKSGATTILNLSPSIEMKQKMLDLVDYLIVNSDEAAKLAGKMDISATQNALKIAHGLSKQGKLTCILTQGEKGCIAVTKEGAGWSMSALNLEEVTDKAGAEDAFCGTFAACIQSGLPIASSLKRASIAATLTCTKKGIHEALPYLDDIEQQMANLPEAEQASF